LVAAEFAFNNKIHTSTKSLLFKVNYRREPRMSFEIRKKEKHTKTEEFMKEIKKEVVEYKVGDKVLLSMRDIMW